jgi:hypothetical protein
VVQYRCINSAVQTFEQMILREFQTDLTNISDNIYQII